MTRRFGGFLTSEEPSLQIPRVFVAEVLPQIADAAELKVTICLFDLLAEAGGYDVPLAEETVYRHEALRASLKRLGSPKEPDESIGRGLELAVSRGTMLRFMATPAEGANGRGQSWYLLNTPRNREALGKMARGVAPPPPALNPPDGPSLLIEPERPNVFRLYEQNVGLLTPIIADQLIEATERYPLDWIEEAFGEAVSYNKRNWRYIRAILEKWAADGRGGQMRSIGDVLKALERSIPRSTVAGAPTRLDAPACPICKDAGFLRLNVPITDPRFGQLIPCECRLREQELRKHEELLKISNLGQFEHKTFEEFDPGINRDVANARTIAMRYSADPHGFGKPWLFFMGRCGTGKTHLAAAIANYYITHQGGRALFTIVPDLLDHLRATFNPAATDGVTYDQRFQDVRDVPLLILDDLGTENATPWAKEKLFQIFNHRYNERLSTVVTTNHDFSQIDERIVSRLLDSGLCQDVPIDAPDFRLRGRDFVPVAPPGQSPRRPNNRSGRGY